MSDNMASQSASVSKREHGPIAKILWPVFLAVAGLVLITYLGMDQARDSARQTLQKIFDDDQNMKILKVESVYLPVQAGLPMADMLTNLGVVPRKMIGNLMIVRKDGKKLEDSCAYTEYDFNQSNRNGRAYYSIEGAQVAALRVCGGALDAY